jgi:hypothetical protein
MLISGDSCIQSDGKEGGWNGNAAGPYDNIGVGKGKREMETIQAAGGEKSLICVYSF